MTFEKILNDLTFNKISIKDAYDEIIQKDKMKRINYYAHLENISKDPLKDNQLQELNAIVGILQILYTSGVGSPVSDSNYDTLQEMLIDLGIPRLTGSMEINSANKVEHKYRNLRGTLDKVYYLYPTEKKTNKSRKYLDEWIKSAEDKYFQATGKRIDLNQVDVLLQNKFDGASCIVEVDNKPVWLTRGDTRNNKASDISHIMNCFNDVYCDENGIGIKFEAMISEEDKDHINELYRHHQYKNSRQVVTSILNSNEPDFKVDYLFPIPLRIMRDNDDIEQIHPKLMELFPTKICKLGDRDIIKEFANNHKYVTRNKKRFRTDGVVITIMDPHIQKILGRDNDINNFEVAYKFTEESAYTRVKDVEFYVSEFGFITPVLVVNDVILKGNTINRISLSNRERFDELNLSYGDEVKVLYDIIPYVTLDEKCSRVLNGRKIEFTHNCPACNEPLDLSNVMVQCTNYNCPSRIIGRILNYCTNLRIQHIGYQTLDALWKNGLLDNGIRSLYKLKKKSYDIQDIEGFGKIKTKKMITEIEAKRRLKDYEFFGSIGIEGLSIKTFKSIFSKIKLSEFIDMIKLKNFDLMLARLVKINGIGELKAESLVNYLKDIKFRNEILKLLEEVTLYQTYGESNATKGKIVFSGCRPSPDVELLLTSNEWEATESWTNKASYLVIPRADFESTKVEKARANNIPIIIIGDNDPIDVLRNNLGIK